MHVSITVLLAASAIVTGCAGGPATPRGTVNLSLEDARILAAVRTAVLNDPDLGSLPIAVECQSGVVTLTGRVRTGSDAQRAEQIVRRVPGVRSVESQLRIEPDRSRTGARRTLFEARAS